MALLCTHSKWQAHITSCTLLLAAGLNCYSSHQNSKRLIMNCQRDWPTLKTSQACPNKVFVRVEGRTGVPSKCPKHLTDVSVSHVDFKVIAEVQMRKKKSWLQYLIGSMGLTTCCVVLSQGPVLLHTVCTMCLCLWLYDGISCKVNMITPEWERKMNAFLSASLNNPEAFVVSLHSQFGGFGGLHAVWICNAEADQNQQQQKQRQQKQSPKCWNQSSQSLQLLMVLLAP